MIDYKQYFHYPSIANINSPPWKIVNHDYAGFINFEKSHKTLQPDEDEEKIKRIIDNEYGESPFNI